MSSLYWTEQGRLDQSMKIALIASAGFHVILFLAGLIGMPLMQKPILNTSPVIVELVDIAEIATTNKTPQPAPFKSLLDKPKLEEPPKPIAPPKVEAATPPKVKPLEKPPEPKKEKPADPPKDSVPPPDQAKLEEPKEKDKPKPPEPKKEEVTDSAEDPLGSLLRNLQDTEPAAQDYAPDAPLAPTMTRNELSALSQQLIGCWQIPIGAKNISNMIVNVRIWANPDRTVRKVEIANDGWMGSDPAFQALAESARRAALDPRCSPLELPLDKIDVWRDKYIEVPFDPSRVT